MSQPLGFIWAIAWYSPYTSPPHGWPRVAAEVFIPCERPGEGAKQPAVITACLREMEAQGRRLGYTVTCSALSPAPKQLPSASLASVRRQRLVRRLNATAPLLAEDMLQQALCERPAYFAGITDPALQAAKDEVLTAEAERRAWFLAHPLVLRVA